MPRPLSQTHPELSIQFVDPAQADVISSGSHVQALLWCDGLIRGNARHRRVEFEHTVFNFTSGYNACPVCGRGGSGRTIAALHPGLVDRLTKQDQAMLPAKSRQKVRLWCDGLVQSREKHRRRVYWQIAASFTSGANGCPACGGPGRARRR